MNTTEATISSLPSFDSFFSWIAVTLIGLSGALFVAEALGFLPARFTRWMNRNRLAQTLEILTAFGVDVDGARRRNRAAALDQTPGETVVQRTGRLLKKFRLTGTFAVGHTVRLTSDHFHDVMGATCNPALAKSLARDLTAHWRTIISDHAEAVEDRFDFVATPKMGSPLLGAAFAELMRKPLVLHVDEPKFDGGAERFRRSFDCDVVPDQGTRALIVDDSSTGGGKVIRLIEDLRDMGYKVEDVLVVFEPQLKSDEGANAAHRLQPLKVRLHSIVKT